MLADEWGVADGGWVAAGMLVEGGVMDGGRVDETREVGGEGPQTPAY